MKNAVLCMISVALANLILISGCGRSDSANVQKADNSTQPAATNQQTEAPPANSIVVKGVLLNADGSPAAGRTVTLHPLDKKGAPLFVSVFEETGNGGATPKPWNPKSESDNEGRFSLVFPRIDRFGDDPLKEIVLAVDAKPQGGWVTGMVSKIHYADKGKEEDLCFLKEDASIKLVRNGGGVLKISVADSPNEVDVGTVAVP